MLGAQPSLAPACCVPFETMEWQHCLSVHGLRADQIHHLVEWVVRSIPYLYVPCTQSLHFPKNRTLAWNLCNVETRKC